MKDLQQFVCTEAAPMQTLKYRNKMWLSSSVCVGTLFRGRFMESFSASLLEVRFQMST